LFGGREIEPGLVALDGGIGRARGRVELSRIDAEQKIADLDALAVLEMDALELAGDLGADLDIVYRLEAARHLGPVHDLAFDGLGHRDGQSRHFALGESGGGEGHEKRSRDEAASKAEHRKPVDRGAICNIMPQTQGCNPKALLKAVMWLFCHGF
jgi:hypothetical protein